MKNLNIESPSIEVVEVNDSSQLANKLIDAVKENNLELVKSLTSNIGIEDLNQQDKYGKTALHYAYVNPRIAEILLNKMADPSIRSNKFNMSVSSDRDGVDPIGMTIANGSEEVIELFIRYLKKQESPSADSPMDYSSAPEASSTALVSTRGFSSLLSADYYYGEEIYKIEKQFVSNEQVKDVSLDPRVSMNKLEMDIHYLRPDASGKGIGYTPPSDYSILPTLKVGPKIDHEKSFQEEPFKISNNLHIAAERTFNPGLSCELITQLFRTGKYGINDKDSMGRTPLHRAIQMRNLEAVETLLMLGADVNSEYCKIKNEAMYPGQESEEFLKKMDYQDPKVANLEEQFFGVQILSSQNKKPRINQPDSFSRDKKTSENGNTPLIMALKNFRHNEDENDDNLTPIQKQEKEDDMKMIHMILSDRRLNFNTPGEDLKTVLHVVAEKSMYRSMDIFLESKKFEIDSQDDFGDTALHLAAKKGDIKMFNKIMEHGASINIKNKEDKTALDILQQFHDKIKQEEQQISSAKQQLEREGISSQQENTALISLRTKKDELSVQLRKMQLICQSSSSRASNDLLARDPQSILFNAVKRNEIEEVERLLLHDKVSPKIMDANKTTPLHLAVLNKNLKIVDLLLSARAPISPQDKMGNTPLHYAVISNQVEMAKFLLDKRKEIYYSANFNNENAFDLAVANKNSQMLQLLMPNFIEAIKMRNNTTYLACEKHTTSSCEKILDDKAMRTVFLDFRDRDGKSIIDIAQANGLTDLVNLFRTKGLVDSAIDQGVPSANAGEAKISRVECEEIQKS